MRAPSWLRSHPVSRTMPIARTSHWRRWPPTDLTALPRIRPTSPGLPALTVLKRTMGADKPLPGTLGADKPKDSEPAKEAEKDKSFDKAVEINSPAMGL